MSLLMERLWTGRNWMRILVSMCISDFEEAKEVISDFIFHTYFSRKFLQYIYLIWFSMFILDELWVIKADRSLRLNRQIFNFFCLFFEDILNYQFCCFWVIFQSPVFLWWANFEFVLFRLWFAASLISYPSLDQSAYVPRFIWTTACWY